MNLFVWTIQIEIDKVQKNAQRTLDEAVAAAYGRDTDISDDDVLCWLLKLNQERS